MDARHLQSARESMGITYCEVARRSGRNLHTVRRMLTERQSPTLRTYNDVRRAIEDIARERGQPLHPSP